ncbi:hypothetical protein EI545_15990 [Tabrizicola piscis]|uniref:Uncharacterized protein n=1 Tax=Tabrizicola piscis TaxID=2494374 RepID=A0A3S8U9C2_9RHOB|nr:hypothetical protein [Tabrizicola piscis]AZL60196.1 hypothetical protein EI545_15990 [Tabrizicola piscis]
MKNRKVDARKHLRDGVRKDCEEGKRFPNSIGAIVRSVFREWPIGQQPTSTTAARTSAEFLEHSNFLDIFLSVLERYPGSPDRGRLNPINDEATRNKVATYLEDIGTQKKPLEFTRLRAIAEFLGIDEGAFFVISRLISLERRAFTQVEAAEIQLQYLNAIESMVLAAKEEIKDAQDASSFSRVQNTSEEGREIWIADLEAVRRLIDAYGRNGLQLVDAALKRQ